MWRAHGTPALQGGLRGGPPRASKRSAGRGLGCHCSESGQLPGAYHSSAGQRSRVRPRSVWTPGSPTSVRGVGAGGEEGASPRPGSRRARLACSGVAKASLGAAWGSRGHTHQVHGLARHPACDEAHLGHQGHRPWSVSIPPPTELLRDPLPAGLRAFATETGVTTEPGDEAQRAEGPAHTCAACACVCALRVSAGAQALGAGWVSALGVPGGASPRGLTGWAPRSGLGPSGFRSSALPALGRM